MANKDSDKNEKNGAFILALFLLFAGAVLFMRPNLVQQNNQSELSSVGEEQMINQKINRNLKAADVRRELEMLKVQIENERAARIREVDEALSAGAPNSLNVQQESHAESVMQDLEKLQGQSDDSYLDPSDVVERRIARDQALADYDSKYKKEYIRSFLRNARAQGLEVELDENMDVIGIREAPLDEPLRFPNSVSGQGGSAQ